MNMQMFFNEFYGLLYRNKAIPLTTAWPAMISDDFQCIRSEMICKTPVYL